MQKRLNFKGMNTFMVIWLSQLLSIFGSAMTRFAFTIWAYQQTGQVTTLALMGFFNSAAYVVFSPLAGVIVDRHSRKRVILLADLGAGLVTAGMLVLYLSGRLEIWHIYLGGVLNNALGAFQEPAFTASIRLLVPEHQLVRANSLLSLASDGSRMFAPVLAGALMVIIGVNGVMTIDLVTCLAAVGVVLALRIPNPAPSLAGQSAGSMRGDLAFGFRYIARRPGLSGILIIFSVINLLAALTYFGVLPAMILARSGSDQTALGAVQSVLGVGGVVGGVLLSVWGGPDKRVYGFLGATAISFLLGDLLFAAGRTLPAWLAAAFISSIFIPFIISCFEAIWQSSVPPEMQGRVFSAKNMIQVSSMPLGYLAGGFLADHVFEPAMASGGSLAGSLGWLVGSGPGAGMALMFACTCIFGLLTGLAGFFIPAIRNVERESVG
jgi:MFS transporter, DHA3 family, macrolide efflux protein